MNIEAFDFDGDYGREYDDLVRRVIPGYEHLFLAALALLEGRVGDSADVLVVGAGTGMEIALFGRRHPGWRITAVDPAERMVAVSLSRVRAMGAEGRIRVVHGTAGDLPRSSAFDAATIFNVMHFLPDDGSKEALLRSVAERLKPGGTMVLFDLHGMPGTPEFRLGMDAWERFMEANGLVGAAKERFLDRLDEGIEYVAEERIRALWESVGLRNVLTFWRTLLYAGWLLERA